MTNITRKRARLSLCLICAASPLAALELSLPSGARMTAERVTDPGSYAVPTGAWRDPAGIPVTRAEGRISRQAYRIDATGLTTLQILAPLREQLRLAGYELLFDCATKSCGGFDFRFETEVMRGPDMYVDLTAYRFVSARGPAGDYLTLLISRSESAGYVQIIRAGEGTAPSPVEVRTDAPALPSEPVEGLAAELEARGHAILHDLAFETGTSSLGEGAIASLDLLAAYLRDNPTRRIVFVGHTDAVGSLAANTALSRKRAEAALRYLRDTGTAANQVSADGVGYLSPVASNLTEAGREENRRIEAVLLSTE